MRRFAWNAARARKHCQSRRSLVNPNDGFWRSLCAFEQVLGITDRSDPPLPRQILVGFYRGNEDSGCGYQVQIQAPDAILLVKVDQHLPECGMDSSCNSASQEEVIKAMQTCRDDMCTYDLAPPEEVSSCTGISGSFADAISTCVSVIKDLSWLSLSQVLGGVRKAG